jgi:hypothetical protein
MVHSRRKHGWRKYLLRDDFCTAWGIHFISGLKELPSMNGDQLWHC